MSDSSFEAMVKKYSDELMRMKRPVAAQPPVAEEAPTVEPAPAEPERIITSEPEYKGSGTLLVTVRTADGTIPIEGAVVTVTNGDGSKLIATATTDMSGSAPLFTLPAPVGDPYAKDIPAAYYNVSAAAEGYETAESMRAAVFDKQRSIQSFEMIPIPSDGSNKPQIYENEEPEF